MKKTDSLLVKALQAVWSVALIAVLILTSVDLNCCWPFYADQYRQLNTAQTIGMSEEDLDLTTDVLLDYTQGKRGNLDVQAVIGGQVQEVFNQREKDHMVERSGALSQRDERAELGGGDRDRGIGSVGDEKG